MDSSSKSSAGILTRSKLDTVDKNKAVHLTESDVVALRMDKIQNYNDKDKM
jgi:hypothetical protein